MTPINRTVFVALLFGLSFVFCGSTAAAEHPSIPDTLNTIRIINRDLRELHDNPLLPQRLDRFADNIKSLQNIDSDIKYLIDESQRYRDDKNYSGPLTAMQAQQAAAFLHAWAIFTTHLKKYDNDDQTALYQSHLPILLTIYGQISKSVGDINRAPLVACLPPDEKTDPGLRRKDLLSAKLFQETIPSTSQLIGDSSDEIANNGVYTTLWSIANDHNEHRKNQTVGQSEVGQSDWLAVVSSCKF